MMKKVVILLLISGLVLVTPHAFATAGGFRGGEEIEVQELAVILEVEILTAIIVILVLIAILLILGHLEWGAGIIEEGFGNG